MNKFIKMTVMITGIVFGMAIAPIALAQQGLIVENVSLENTQKRVLTTQKGEVFELLIALPDGYNQADAARYPVYYVLDADAYFSTLVESYRVQSLGNDIKPIIIVGISYPSGGLDQWFVRRAGEFTPSGNEEFDKNYTEQYSIATKTGGADAYRKVLRDEIMPTIDKNYATSDVKAVFGHSLGGLFAAYDLLQKDRLFNLYSISSPSLWWDDEVTFKTEAMFAKNHKDIDAELMLSVGALEGPVMVPPMQRFGDVLKSRNYKSLKMTTKVFENENHLSVQPATLSRSLRVLFAAEKKQ